MPEPKATSPRYAIGADIGGTHITSALVDLQKREILPDSDFHQKVDASEWPSQVVPAWGEVLKKSIALVPANELAGIGLAMPGPFDYQNGISQITGLTKYERLFGLNVKHALSQYLGLDMSNIRLMNDANCFLFGESWITEKAYKRVIGITLGTGFGAAFLSNDAIVESGIGVPPNAEFFPVPFRGVTAEDLISSRGILKLYKEKTGVQLEGVREVAQRADQKEAEALAVLNEFGETLGDFLGYWLKSFEAEAIIIGGNISRAHPFFVDRFKSVLAQQQVEVDVIISQMLDQAGILGAGRLFEKGDLRREQLEVGGEVRGTRSGQESGWRFELEDGSVVENLEALLFGRADGGNIIFYGEEALPWEFLKNQIAATLKHANQDVWIYQTSPEAIAHTPGYVLTKIKAEPGAVRCILLGPKSEEVGWKGTLVRVQS